MKITDEHYAVLRKEIEEAIGRNPDAYEQYKKEGLSDTRYNWDLLYASQIKIHSCNNVPTILTNTCLPLYDYMNDEHINTALKKITGRRGC